MDSPDLLSTDLLFLFICLKQSHFTANIFNIVKKKSQSPRKESPRKSPKDPPNSAMNEVGG